MATPTTSNNAASSGGGGLHGELHETIKQMELLKVFELKTVCRAIELPLGGRKAVLQDRIRAFLKHSLSVGHIDPWRPKAVKILMDKAVLGDDLPKYEILWESLKTGAYNHPVATGRLPVSALQGSVSVAVPSTTAHANTVSVNAGNSNTISRKSTKQKTGTKDTGSSIRILHFIDSPFYKFKKLLADSLVRAKQSAYRGVANANFKFTAEDWTLLQNKRYKVYLFSGIDYHEEKVDEAHSIQPIQFPHPNEIRMNGSLVKDNVRGIKNKPETAKPANLSPYLNGAPMMNRLEVIYATTKDDFILSCYIVEEITPEQLLQVVLKNPQLIKSATLSYLKKMLSEEDDDIITTSTVMSLQCPVSYTKMQYPAKSLNCKHLQCFDAKWFIHSQLQVPTWQCPVCQVPVKIETLAICQYVDEILKSTDDEVEQVELSLDGSWVSLDEDGNKIAQNNNVKPQLNESAKSEVKKEKTEDSLSTSIIPSASVVLSHSEPPAVISLDSDDEEIPEDQALTAHLQAVDTPVQVAGSTHSATVNSNSATVNSNSASTSFQTQEHNNETENENSQINASHSNLNIPPRRVSNNSTVSSIADVSSTQNIPPTAAPTFTLVNRGLLGNGLLQPTNDIDLGGGSILGFSGQTSILNPTPESRAPVQYSAPVNMQNGDRNQHTDIVNRSNGNNNVNNNNNNTSILTTNNNELTGNHNAEPRNILGITGDVPTLFEASTSNPAPAVPNLVRRNEGPLPMVRPRKTNVSPFIPKKPYASMLPQKRPNPSEYSNRVSDSQTNASLRLGITMDTANTETPINSQVSNTSDVIDLTSED